MTLKSLLKTITKEEIVFVLKISLLTAIITSLPLLFCFITKPADSYFPFTSYYNFVDYHNYFSYIEQAREGFFVFKDLYTSEPQPRIIFNIFFLFLGLIAKFLNLSAPLVFQLSRVFMIFVFSFVSYYFLAYFFSNLLQRKIAFLFLIFSSGISGLLFFIGLLPIHSGAQGFGMDIWVPEAITFSTLATNPLFIASLTFIILIFFLLLLAKENNDFRYALGSGFFSLLLFQFHPYHIPTIFAVIGCYFVYLSLKKKGIDWHFLSYCLIVFFISLPSLIYYFWLSTSHWLTVERIRQAFPAGFTPNFFYFLLSYGLLFPLALIAIFKKARKWNDRFIFLVIWLLAQIFLIYSPLPLQRRLSEGLHVVIVILSVFGLFTFFNFRKEKIGLYFAAFFWFLAFSNVLIISVDLAAIENKMLFLPKENIEAMKWLRKNSKENEVILSSPYWNGNFIPGVAVRPVYAGHGVETAFFETKENEINWFFNDNQSNEDEKKRNFLKRADISYVFWSNEEKELGNFQPKEKNYLQLIYENEKVSIFKDISD